MNDPELVTQGDAVPPAPSAPAWSMGLGFELLKAWKGPCWGAMVAIGLTFSILGNLDDLLWLFVRSSPGLLESGAPILQMVTPWASLLTTVLVVVPVNAALPLIGCAAIDGDLKSRHMFLAYRRFLGVLGAGLWFGAAVFVLFLLPALLVAMLLPAIAAATKSGGGGVPVAALVIASFAGLAYLYWATRVMMRALFGPAIVCDTRFRSLRIRQAFVKSAEVMRGNEWRVFGFLVLVGILSALTVLLVGIGLLLIGWPLMLCAYGAVYRTLVLGRPLPRAA